MEFQPLGLRVFAKRSADWESKVIARPDNPDKQSLEVTILRIGHLVTYPIKVGDRVAIGRFGQYEPPRFDADNKRQYEDCVIVNEDDILGIITEEVGNGNG